MLFKKKTTKTCALPELLMPSLKRARVLALSGLLGAGVLLLCSFLDRSDHKTENEIFSCIGTLKLLFSCISTL